MPELNDLMRSAGIAAIAVFAGWLIAFLLTSLLQRGHRRRPIRIGEIPIEPGEWNGPIRALLPSLALRLVTPSLQLPDSIAVPLGHLVNLLIIGSVAWVATRTVGMGRLMIEGEYPIDVEDNLEARRVRTQVRIIARILNVAIIVIAVAAMLMTFEGVRQLGVSLLASAGVAGIVLGFAAQKSIGTLLAGIQIALTQPIRLDDVVIVEGEWGRIEEITLTYVVVEIWDQRRLIVPVTYFLDHAFENWTRTSAAILDTVYLYADYSIPVDEVRAELKRILDSTDLWDRRAWGLVVTNTTDRSIELRALMSAEDASDSWNLRCLVREQLIAYMQANFPDRLPRIRVEGTA